MSVNPSFTLAVVVTRTRFVGMRTRLNEAFGEQMEPDRRRAWMDERLNEVTARNMCIVDWMKLENPRTIYVAHTNK